MTRAVWKGPFVHPSLLKKIDKLKNNPAKKPTGIAAAIINKMKNIYSLKIIWSTIKI